MTISVSEAKPTPSGTAYLDSIAFATAQSSISIRRPCAASLWGLIAARFASYGLPMSIQPRGKRRSWLKSYGKMSEAGH